MPEPLAAERYAALKLHREPYLRRARACAELTVPTLLPPEGYNGSYDFHAPYQSLGARGVNNMVAKLLLALLPPNSPFFKLSVDDFVLVEMTGQDDMRAEVEEALNTIERSVMSEIEFRAMRIAIHEGLKQLAVAGNVLLFITDEGIPRVFRLDRYVVRRDPSGNVMEIVVHEEVSPKTLPEGIREAVEAELEQDEHTVDLYTHVTRENSNWKIYQQVKSVTLPGAGTYPLDKTPWLPLRWTRLDGEDYGRGHVEEYFGDLKSLEGLSKAIIEGSAIAARVVGLVSPNGQTDEDDLNEAENGAIISGLADDVTFLQVQKQADFRVALETIRDITERLSFAFMLNTAIQRNAERVTAEEIRFMAGELEDALGGTYSVLSQELQLPFVTVVMHSMEKRGKLPKLPKESIRPTITTGLEALGRGHDLNKLDAFIQGLAGTMGPEVLQRYLNVSDYITRRGAALGIDMDGLVRSEEEVQQEMQQAQMQQMLQQLGPNAINQLGGMAQKGMEQPNDVEAG